MDLAWCLVKIFGLVPLTHTNYRSWDVVVKSLFIVRAHKGYPQRHWMQKCVLMCVFRVFPIGSPANHSPSRCDIATHTAGNLHQRSLHRARADLKGLASHHNRRGVNVHFAHGSAAIWAGFWAKKAVEGIWSFMRDWQCWQVQNLWNLQLMPLDVPAKDRAQAARDATVDASTSGTIPFV